MATHEGRTPVALVTGGTGFLGRHLVGALVARGWGVRTCARRARPPDLPPEVEHREVDLCGRDGATSKELCRGVDVVFHTAGAMSTGSSPQEMQALNVDATAQLLEAATTTGVARFVHVSTSSVYGTRTPLPQPVREDAACDPSPGYGETKWRAEQLVREYGSRGLPATVLRPTTIYGPGAVKLLASTVLDAAIERFAGLGTFRVGAAPVELRLVHVDDVVGALVHLGVAEGVAGRAFNVSAATYPTSHDVAQLVADELGTSVELVDDPDAGLSFDERRSVRDRMIAEGMRGDIVLSRERVRFLQKANRNNRLSLDALRATGFEPAVGVPGSIRANVRWYRAERWIL